MGSRIGLDAVARRKKSQSLCESNSGHATLSLISILYYCGYVVDDNSKNLDIPGPDTKKTRLAL
jgi:hypothetical protein